MTLKKAVEIIEEYKSWGDGNMVFDEKQSEAFEELLDNAKKSIRTIHKPKVKSC